MAVKTFTTGEVLTAADTNTYLNNGGLVYIKSQTIGSAVSSVQVTSAFSSTYDNYKILVNGGAGSATANLRVTLGSSATGYSEVLLYTAYNNTPLALGAGTANTAFVYAGTTSANGHLLNLDLISPNLAKYTGANGPFFGITEAGTYMALHQVATAYTSFTITPQSGTLTGGTITVYGYRLG